MNRKTKPLVSEVGHLESAATNVKVKMVNIRKRLQMMVYGIILCGHCMGQQADLAVQQPNILWITCEDMSPHLLGVGSTKDDVG